MYSVKNVLYRTGPSLQKIRFSQRFSSLHKRLKFNILCSELMYKGILFSFCRSNSFDAQFTKVCFLDRRELPLLGLLRDLK